MNLRLPGLLPAVVIGCIAGCSAQPQHAGPPPGALSPGTARIVIDGTESGQIDSVRCRLTAPLTTITTGDQASGTSTVISNANALTAESVAIRNMGGFTGSYNVNLGGRTDVTMTGNTYVITGSAEGYTADNPGFTASRTFSIKATC
jgi:ipoprotein LpqH